MSEPLVPNVPETVISHYVQITKNVVDQLSELNPQIRERVVKHKVEEALEDRTNLVLKGLQKLDDLQKDLKKIQPDQLAYDESGKEMSKSFSKTKIEEKKKVEEVIKKHEQALEKGLVNGDYDQLKKLCN